MTWLTNVLFENKEIENERLELTDKGSLYFLTHNLVLRDCTIILKASARNVLINGASFFNCTFDVKQELKNHQDWVFAALKGCRFKGRFLGCDFGRWPGYSDGWEHGSIEDCDFTEARLHASRFHGCDPSTLRLPRWPCFTFLEPHLHRHEWLARSWPGDMGPLVMNGLAKNPPSTMAETWFAPALAKKFGISPEALKAVIERCSNIFY